jgi:hypothetical protein
MAITVAAGNLIYGHGLERPGRCRMMVAVITRAVTTRHYAGRCQGDRIRSAD